ncbi:unnamed protein product [Moneuplotes crassus]|uniref:Uncharacterized protein n=1 Tax=Euplotes crassus TaxID=5936 RepID=A0AAD1UBT8_EUPCR|nr:unnamed protein product [Moneuplotes crassus]
MESSTQSMQLDKTLACYLEKFFLENNEAINKRISKNHCINSYEIIGMKTKSIMILLEDIELYFNLNCYKDVKFIERLPFCVISSAQELEVDQIKIRNKRVIKFLSSSFPQKVSEFSLVSAFGYTPNIFPYFNVLLRQSSRVTNVICIGGFKLNDRQFKRLMVSYAHVHEIKLCSCNLSLPATMSFDGLLKNTRIQSIDLSYSEHKVNSVRMNNLDGFKRLIQVLGSSPNLKLTLKVINISCFQIEESDAREILNENELGQVSFIDE